MKAFLFSDLHCNNKQLANLYDFVIQNKSIEVLIFAGDVVNMGEPVWFMEKFVKVIDELKLPFLWVPGNNDFGRAFYKINARYKSLEGRVVIQSVIPTPLLVIPAEAGIQKNTILDPRAPLSSCIAGPEPFQDLRDDKKNNCHPERLSCHPELVSGSHRFTGVGGSPASWAGQYEGESMVDKKAIANSIFISHVPPPGILVLQQKDLPTPLLNCHLEHPRRYPEQSEGSINKDSSALPQNDTAVPKRRFSDAPLVHICGHLHYRWGTAYLGQTKVIQLASLETGHYAILDLETLAVEFKRFR